MLRAALTRAAQPLSTGEQGSYGDRVNEGRFRVGIEICYCSTLDDCWTLIAGEQRDSSTHRDGPLLRSRRRGRFRR